MCLQTAGLTVIEIDGGIELLAPFEFTRTRCARLRRVPNRHPSTDVLISQEAAHGTR